MRKYKVLKVAPDLIVEICKSGVHQRTIENPLPADARLAGVGKSEVLYDAHTASLCFVIESDSFPEVPEGARIPFLDLPVFERVNP
jgi:hypothetical protein